MSGKFRDKIENLFFFFKSYFLYFARELESLLFHLVSCRSPSTCHSDVCWNKGPR